MRYIFVCIFILFLSCFSDENIERYFTYLNYGQMVKIIKDSNDGKYLNEVVLNAVKYGNDYPGAFHMYIYTTSSIKKIPVPLKELEYDYKEIKDIYNGDIKIEGCCDIIADSRDEHVVKLKVEPNILVPDTFFIGFDFNSGRKNGILLGQKKCTNKINKSYSGLPYSWYEHHKADSFEWSVKANFTDEQSDETVKLVEKDDVFDDCIEIKNYTDPNNFYSLSVGRVEGYERVGMPATKHLFMKVDLGKNKDLNGNIEKYNLKGIRVLVSREGYGFDRRLQKVALVIFDEKFNEIDKAIKNYWDIPTNRGKWVDFIFNKPLKDILNKNNELILGIDPSYDSFQGGTLNYYAQMKGISKFSLFSSVDEDSVSSYIGNIKRKKVNHMLGNEWIVNLYLEKKE